MRRGRIYPAGLLRTRRDVPYDECRRADGAPHDPVKAYARAELPPTAGGRDGQSIIRAHGAWSRPPTRLHADSLGQRAGKGHDFGLLVARLRDGERAPAVGASVGGGGDAAVLGRPRGVVVHAGEGGRGAQLLAPAEEEEKGEEGGEEGDGCYAGCYAADLGAG